MTNYQKHIQEQIIETANLIPKIGQKSEFAEIFSEVNGESVKLTKQDISKRLQYLVDAINYEDFEKSSKEREEYFSGKGILY